MEEYSDPAVEVNAFSPDGTPHHTITPIARKRDNYYELDLVLRDNNTSEDIQKGSSIRIGISNISRKKTLA